MGLQDRPEAKSETGEGSWEASPEKVKALYPKFRNKRTTPKYRGTREIPWESGRTIFQG